MEHYTVQIRLVYCEPLVLLVPGEPHRYILKLISVERLFRADNQRKRQRLFMIIDAEVYWLDTVINSRFNNRRFIAKRNVILCVIADIANHKPV